MPAWVFPDHLTVLGVAGALLTSAGFVLSRWSLNWLWLANFGLVVNWIGDSVDGTLARYRHIERPRYGFFVDHTSDLFSQVLIFLAIGLSSFVHFAVACLGLIAYLMGFVYTLIGAQVRGNMRITYFGFGPTEIRALLLFGNLMALAFGLIYVQPPIPALARFGPISTHDVVISMLAVVGAALIAALAISEGRALAIEDPPPAPGSGPGARMPG